MIKKVELALLEATFVVVIVDFVVVDIVIAVVDVVVLLWSCSLNLVDFNKC